jgi:hypothetical protein
MELLSKIWSTAKELGEIFLGGLVFGLGLWIAQIVIQLSFMKMGAPVLRMMFGG